MPARLQAELDTEPVDTAGPGVAGGGRLRVDLVGGEQGADGSLAVRTRPQSGCRARATRDDRVRLTAALVRSNGAGLRPWPRRTDSLRPVRT
jgi:hypothetical protein